MSTNGRGPSWTSGAHTIILGIVLPHLQGTSIALPLMDLPATAISALEPR